MVSLTVMDLAEATIDDIREFRPDLYQEIVEDVLMGSFAGRTDEVFTIIVPAINEMRSEIADVTEQLKHSLESIVEKEARARFKKLMQDIEKATVYRHTWREEQKRSIIEEHLSSLEKNDESAKRKVRKVSVKPETHVETTNKKNMKRPIEKDTHIGNREEIKVGDIVLYNGKQYSIVDITRKYGICRLLVKDCNGRAFTLKDYDVTKNLTHE